MGINLKFPLRAYRKGFFEMNNTTRDAIREDIKILLLTKKGERVVNSTIGTNIPILAGQLFEPAIKEDLEPQITLEVKQALETWMPYVTLESLQVFTAAEVPRGMALQQTQILVVMSYLVNNSEAMRDSIQLTVNGATR
tara:strand:+ start:973 stop:1389 length:417 start_codon:yes stop_codon:yes gene_type:complete